MPDSYASFEALNKKRRILVVEDEIINQEILRYMLEEEYDTLFAAGGEQALGMVQKYADTLSLILLDLNLPDMHGLDVLRRVKENQYFSRIPVIVMTAEKDAEVESLTLGAIDFIPKPYPRPEVVKARALRTIELSEDRDIIRSTERDSLTGLYNREYFYRYARQLDLYHKDQEMDAIIIDINHFHMINERYGKAYGDEVLTRIAGKITGFLEDQGGIACRRAADTFLVYCPHRQDYADMIEKMSVTMTAEGMRENKLRLRMGVYPNTEKDTDLERRFDRAKMAADHVRNSFSGAIGIYDRSMHETEVFAEQLVEGFETAIREKQFVVFYQPKMDIRGDEPVLSSAEALVRWKHPELGLISPGIFIPLFESNGLIRHLDSYVWQEAAAQIRDWKERLGVTIPVSVNVSRIDMYDPFLVEKLQGIVKESGIEEKQMMLEVTESAYTKHSEQIIEKVNRLRECGFCIEMDDFGSGYSSLNMISTLPIDVLKLDMQFVRMAFKERKDTRLLEVVLRMAEMLDVYTVAEGVETAEQMLTLKYMGCDIVQGYYFSKPLPPDEFEHFLIEKKKQGVLSTPVRGKRKGMSRGTDRFTYDALHDQLTGLYNNTAFDVLFHDSDKEHIAVLIARIDGYEEILKTQGRDKADYVVKSTADVLRGSFRSVDVICRLREDEFVIIMTRVFDSMQDLVTGKIDTVNEILQELQSKKMPVSLSVGIALSDREKPDGDLFGDADKALRQAMVLGHGSWVVF